MKSSKERETDGNFVSTVTLKGCRRTAKKLELGQLEMKETNVLIKYAQINKIKLPDGCDRATIIMKLMKHDILGFQNSIDDERYFV